MISFLYPGIWICLCLCYALSSDAVLWRLYLTLPPKMTSVVVKSAWPSKRNFLHHLDPEIRKMARRNERLHLKLLTMTQSEVFNQTCLDKDLLPKYKLYIYIYIYIYMCVCVCVCVRACVLYIQCVLNSLQVDQELNGLGYK